MKRKIGEILVELGYLSQEDVKQALDVQQKEGGRRNLGEILMEMFLKKDEITHALSLQFNVPVLKEDQIPDVMPIESVSFDFLKENLILPVGLEDVVLMNEVD